MMNFSTKNHRQILRYIIVGLGNTTFSYLVYATALYAGLTFAYANLCAVLFGILVSFRTQRDFVFGPGRSGAFIRYLFFWATIWTINVAIIYLIKIYTDNEYLAGAIAMAPIIILSYFLQKFWVFKDYD